MYEVYFIAAVNPMSSGVILSLIMQFQVFNTCKILDPPHLPLIYGNKAVMHGMWHFFSLFPKKGMENLVSLTFYK